MQFSGNGITVCVCVCQCMFDIDKICRIKGYMYHAKHGKKEKKEAKENKHKRTKGSAEKKGRTPYPFMQGADKNKTMVGVQKKKRKWS